MNNTYLQQDSETPLVSIVIRTYFRERSLARTLEAIANSNYPGNKIEIIVVKDSKDQGAENVVNTFKQKYPEVSIILL
jgi:glycosyltransferase involved in cell wall biosynthesis